MATILEEKRALLDTAHRLGAIKAHTYNDCLRKITRLSLADCKELAKPATHSLSHATMPAPGGQGESRTLASMPGSMPEDELSMHTKLVGLMGRLRTYAGRRVAMGDRTRAMEVMQAFNMACSAMEVLCDEMGKAPVNLGLSTVALSDAESSALHAANTYCGMNLSAGQIALARAHAPVMTPAAKVIELSSASAPGQLTRHELSTLKAAQAVGVRVTADDMIKARGRLRS